MSEMGQADNQEPSHVAELLQVEELLKGAEGYALDRRIANKASADKISVYDDIPVEFIRKVSEAKLLLSRILRRMRGAAKQ